MQLLVLEISWGKIWWRKLSLIAEIARSMLLKHLLTSTKMKQSATRKVSAHIETCLEQYLSGHPQEKAMHEAMLAAKNNPPPPPANESDRSAQAEFGPSVSAPDASSNNNSKLCDNMKNVWGDSYQEGSEEV